MTNSEKAPVTSNELAVALRALAFHAEAICSSPTPSDMQRELTRMSIARALKLLGVTTVGEIEGNAPETLAVDHPAHATAAEVADCRICTPHRKWPGEPPHCPTCDCPTPKAKVMHKCKGCGAEGEPGSPDFCSADCFENYSNTLGK